MAEGINLVIVTPTGEAERVQCSAVTLYARDNKKGEGGGSVGILRGHAPAVIALEESSRIICTLDGQKKVFTVDGGFASVQNDTVTVVTPRAEKRY